MEGEGGWEKEIEGEGGWADKCSERVNMNRISVRLINAIVIEFIKRFVRICFFSLLCCTFFCD